jgi:hypothetical protein
VVRSNGDYTLGVAKCKEFWYHETGDLYKLKHQWHSPEELFHLRGEKLEVGGFGGTLVASGFADSYNEVREFKKRDKPCIAAKEGKVVLQKDCKDEAAVFKSDFDPELQTQVLSFQSKSSCLTIKAMDSSTIMSACSKSKLQQFTVSYAGDGLVVDYPVPTMFRTDQGPAFGEYGCHCEDSERRESECCESLTNWQRTADYFTS